MCDCSSDVCSSDLGIVAVALQREAARDQVEPHRVGHRIAETAEERERLRIHRLALRQVDARRTSLAVAEQAAQLIGGADARVEAACLVLDQARGLAAHSGVRTFMVCRALQQRAARYSILGRGADRKST